MNNSTFKYSYLNFDNGRIKNEIITVFCPPFTLLALLSSSFHRGPAFHPECSRSGKAPSVWIVALLDIISSSVTSPFRLSPRFENFSASVLSSVGSPPFATDVSITFHDFAPTLPSNCRSVYEYLARLDISFDAAFVVIDWRMKFGRKMQQG